VNGFLLNFADKLDQLIRFLDFCGNIKMGNESFEDSGAKFSKLLRKIFGRLLFQRKYVDFQNFFGKCLWKNLRRSSKEDFEKGYTIFETSLETS